jgi:hypothetical protein
MRVARAKLTVHAGREPEPSEPAGFLGMELEDVERALAVPAEPTSRAAFSEPPPRTQASGRAIS